MEPANGEASQPGGKLRIFWAILMGHRAKWRVRWVDRFVVDWINRPSASTTLILKAFAQSVHFHQLTHLFRLRRRTYRSRRAFLSELPADGKTPRRSPYVKSLLCPTRGRARNVRRFVKSVYRTCDVPAGVEMLFYVDQDDPQLQAYRRAVSALSSECAEFRRLELVVGEPMSISKSWNVLAERCEGDLLMMANDDQYYVDYGWDRILDRRVEGYPDDIFAMFFDDGQYPPDSGDFPIVSRRWYETLGYFAPGIFEFWYNEVWIFDVANRLGRVENILHVLVDHLHYTHYLGVFDDTYQRHRLSSDKADRDYALYHNTTSQRQAAADKLRPLMKA